MKVFWFVWLIITLIFCINYFMVKTKVCKSFLVAFECGFNSILWEMSKMSIHFFKIGIIFILFDLELMFLMLVIKSYSSYKIIIIIHVFILTTFLVEGVYRILKWSF